MRQERIERLLSELKYEITRGMMEREIEEHLAYEFVVPVSKEGPGQVVNCSFRCYPSETYLIHKDDLKYGPKLRVIE
jgi:hypothetical protein